MRFAKRRKRIAAFVQSDDEAEAAIFMKKSAIEGRVIELILTINPAHVGSSFLS